MTDQHELEVIRSFTAFADRLVDDFDLLELTTQLTEDCARLLNIAAAGLLLADAGGTLHVLAATSEQARRLEVFQLQREEGPCLDCYRTGLPVTVPDLTADLNRWPRFSAVAAEQGFTSVHAIPMRLRGHRLGALGLFGSGTGELNVGDLSLARGLAHVASIAIVHDNRILDNVNLLTGLQAAVASRATLELAKGVLGEICSIDAQEAFDRLRGYADAHHRGLTDVAREVVSGEHRARQILLTELGDPALAHRAAPTP